ncbi:MAG: hypothetical protein GEV07_09270 [Streptosporangiales bacterium]|nr:hypothetical protein [Streptosporangiales bacterium]
MTTTSPAAFGIGTDFDQPTQVLPVPGAVTSGGQPELKLVDGLTRGDGVVGRFETSPGLFAVKVAEPTGPVRVTVELAADAETAAWWERLVPEHVQPRTPHGARLLAVRAQGATRGTVLLARRVTDFGLRARQRVSFPLAAEELPADGFLVIDVTEVEAHVPAWAEPTTERPAVGVRVDAVHATPTGPEPPMPTRPGATLDAPTCDRLGLIAAGGSTESTAIDVRADYFVAQPMPAVPGPVTWTLQPQLVGEVRPDPARPGRGSLVFPKPAPGQPPLSTRQKAQLVAQHELGNFGTDLRRRMRHLAVRGVRKAARPLDQGLSSRTGAELLARGQLRAVLVPIGSSRQLPCQITAAAGGRIAVTCTEPPDGAALVHLGVVATDGGPLTRLADRRMHWQLVSARYGQA